MTYWDEKDYWSDASTRNCVWLFQTQPCNCKKMGIHWHTEAVFLTKEEAVAWGNSRIYEWGEKDKGWRIYGVPCWGLMAKILGEQTERFKDKVQHIHKHEVNGRASSQQ